MQWIARLVSLILIYSLKCDLPVDGRISNLFPNFLGFTRYNFIASDLLVVNCDKHTSFIGQFHRRLRVMSRVSCKLFIIACDKIMPYIKQPFIEFSFIHRKRWRNGSLADSCSCCCHASCGSDAGDHHCKVAAKHTKKENGQTRSEM